MNVIKSIKKLSLSTKIQLVIAIILTIVLAITIPTYSWFNYERRVAELAKIKSPDNLYINAAHKEDVIHLDMSTIDLTKTYMTTETYEEEENGETVEKTRDVERSITAQSFVFSVSGEWVNSFTLQIEHTTNNPFTYTFYEGEVYASKTAMKNAHPDCDNRNLTDGSLPYIEYVATREYDYTERTKVKDYPNFPANDVIAEVDPNTKEVLSYVDEIVSGQTYYIWYGDTPANWIKNKDNVTGDYLNKVSGERYANRGSNLTQRSYERNQTYNQYALPVYWQLKNISAGVTKGSSFYKTYIVKVSWTGKAMNNYKKETDLFYISAFVS